VLPCSSTSWLPCRMRRFFFSCILFILCIHARAGRHDTYRYRNFRLGIMISLVPYSGTRHLILVPGFERRFPLDKQLCLCSLDEQPSCWCISNLLSKKGNCSAGFKVADLHGSHFHVLLVSLPCSSTNKAEMRKKSRKWDGIMGMRKHMETTGLEGGKRRRDRMF